MAENITVDEPATGVRRITLNRPEALNAFTFGMYVELLDILERIRLDHKARVVILTGAGRGFCSGHDLRAGGRAEWVDPDASRPYALKQIMGVLSKVPLAMRSLPQPLICAANGVVAGIGYALTLAADITIAAESAKFVNSIHNAGTGAELGMSYLLPRAVGPQRAAELLLTARAVGSAEAARIGLVLDVVPDDELAAAALELARNIMVNVPLGISMTKQSMRLNENASSLEQAMELETRAVFWAQSTEDAGEKRTSFFEKREPSFTFS